MIRRSDRYAFSLNEMSYLPLLGLLVLSACSTTNSGESKVVVQKVDRAVPVACIPSDFPHVPASNVTAGALRAAKDGAARYQMLQEFWNTFEPLLDPVARAIDVCRAK